MNTTQSTTAPFRSLSEGARELILDHYMFRTVYLTCTVGVCIWSAPFQLAPGTGLCRYDLVRGDLRIGISLQVISRVTERDGQLHIVID